MDTYYKPLLTILSSDPGSQTNEADSADTIACLDQLRHVSGVVGHFNLNVPHSLTLNEAKGHLMVADRENSRVLCYTTDGHYVHEFNTGARVYGVSYSPVSGKNFTQVEKI